ncbi:MAG TPA: protein kinase, partial [Polyangiaceae bacterium]|nr:protein kinase [Polyangiaceae bacterium]
PRNVFLTYDGRAKLMDFGIAKAKDALHVTVAGMLKGKVTYMAPEQAMNLPVDRRADVFAAGVLLWESLVGRKLWDKVPLNEVLLRLTRHDLPPAPSVLVADLPFELDRICARALAPDREQRYPTALEFREDLERYMADSGDEVHPREIGQYLATAFADDRAAQRAFVEANVRKQPGDGGEIARLPGPEPVESVGRIRAVPTAHAFAGPPPAGAPFLPPAGGSYPPPANSAFPPPAGGSYPPPPNSAFPPPANAPFPPPAGVPFAPPGSPYASGPPAPARGVPSAPPPPLAPPAPPPPRRRSVWLVAAFAVVGSLASAAVGVLLAVRADPPIASVASAAPAEPSASAAPFLAFSLRVSPPDARVFLDDAELPPEAWNGLRPRDGRPHRLRVEAEGYVPRAQSVVFDDDKLALSITLDKRRAEPLASSSAAPPAASPPSASAASPPSASAPPPPRPRHPRPAPDAPASDAHPRGAKGKRAVAPAPADAD